MLQVVWRKIESVDPGEKGPHMRRDVALMDARRFFRCTGLVWLPAVCFLWAWPFLLSPGPAAGDDTSGAPSRSQASVRAGSSPVEAIANRIKLDLKTAAPAPVEPVESPKNRDPDLEPPVASKETEAGEKPADEPRATATKRPKMIATIAKPGEKDRTKALEAEAQQCKAADEALLLYRIFMADPETTAEEKEKALPRLEFWEQAVKDELIRVGKKWMTKSEADKLKEEADKLVLEAIELLDLKSYKRADEKLERASRVYPDHLESLFLLGVGALLTGDFKGADKRFTQCLTRAPNHVPLLNNAALCAALSKKYDRAVKLWEKAAAIEPDNADIAQNVGRFIADATKAKAMTKAEKTQAAADLAKAKAQGRILIDFQNVDRRVLDDATEVYAKIVAGGKVARADASSGYVILKLFQSKKGGSSSPEESQVVGNGSGFVIWDGFVLTNRHVVEDADGLVLQDPGNAAGEPLTGKVAAVSKDLDLAIVECRNLKAPRVPINSAEVSRGTDVLALGFPVMNVVGKGLKTTRGIVTGLPSKETGNLMVLDVQINPGNSGGPLCDNTGQVIGVVAAKTFTERFVQGYGLAIPMSDALTFIKKSIPEYGANAPSQKKLEWTEVDAQISKSTILIMIKKKRKS